MYNSQRAYRVRTIFKRCTEPVGRFVHCDLSIINYQILCQAMNTAKMAEESGWKCIGNGPRMDRLCIGKTSGMDR